MTTITPCTYARCTPELRSGGINGEIKVVLLPKKPSEQSSEVLSPPATVFSPSAQPECSCFREPRNQGISIKLAETPPRTRSCINLLLRVYFNYLDRLSSPILRHTLVKNLRRITNLKFIHFHKTGRFLQGEFAQFPAYIPLAYGKAIGELLPAWRYFSTLVN